MSHVTRQMFSTIYLGADHGGFRMKESLKRFLTSERIHFVDCGALSYDPHDDYPVYAKAVARAVVRSSRNRGIVLCRSGSGVEIAANKVRGIRSITATDVWMARRSRRDDNANILALPAEHVTLRQARSIVRAWLTTPFRGAKRDLRRLRQIRTLEHAKH